jgi:hypothetical protein
VKHTCHAAGCSASVPPKMLMCLRHWRMVPRDLQRAVWAAYVPGQEQRKDPTREYMVAHHLAVAAVASREGRVEDIAENLRLAHHWGVR